MERRVHWDAKPTTNKEQEIKNSTAHMIIRVDNITQILLNVLDCDRGHERSLTEEHPLLRVWRLCGVKKRDGDHDDTFK